MTLSQIINQIKCLKKDIQNLETTLSEPLDCNDVVACLPPLDCQDILACLPPPKIEIPIPVLGLGTNYILQHTKSGLSDINDFINGTYTSSARRVNGGITQSGVDWANDTLKVSVSYARVKDYTDFLSNSPMIFLELLDNRNRPNNKKRNQPMWIHPPSKKGLLNRTATNYGGGTPSSILTEWDLIVNDYFTDQILEIDYKEYQYNGQALPQRLVDYNQFIFNNLRYQRPKDNAIPGIGLVVSTYVQPIRFRFACIDPIDNRSVLLGEPSETLLLMPKWGYFPNTDDYYVYDYTIKRKT